jgi:uncharacterized protein (TIGR02996 family)
MIELALGLVALIGGLGLVAYLKARAVSSVFSSLISSMERSARRVGIFALVPGLAAMAWIIHRGVEPPAGHELETWLGDHNQVIELYARPSLLEELVYRHLTPPPPDVPITESEQRHPELERQLGDELDAPEPYLVYADWLQEHGDPFGELIALGVVATQSGSEEDFARFERFRKLHEARFLHGVKLAGLGVHWRYGVVQVIEELGSIETTPLATWEQLLRLRVCEFVESIALRRSCTADLDRLIEEHGPRTLRSVTLDSWQHWPEHLMRRALRRIGVFTGRLAIRRDVFPASLEQLEIGSTCELTVEASLALPIRELRVVMNESHAEALRGLKLPNLERLVISLDNTASSASLKLLEALEMPALREIVIADGVLDARSFGKLAKLPLAKSLTAVGLRNLELTDDIVRAMVRTKRAFEALEHLDLSGNELSREGLETARAIAPNVISVRQNRRGDSVEKRIRRWAGTRLTVAEEIAEPNAWKRAGVDGDTRWARYRGEEEYELFVVRDLSEFGCTCPSSYQPCKHVIALALVAERTQLSERKSDGIEDRVRERVAQRGQVVMRLRLHGRE